MTFGWVVGLGCPELRREKLIVPCHDHESDEFVIMRFWSVKERIGDFGIFERVEGVTVEGEV